MSDSNVQGNGAAGTSLEEIARQRDEARQQAESDAAQKLLQEMKENCKRLAFPNAAEDIFKLAKKLSGKE